MTETQQQTMNHTRSSERISNEFDELVGFDALRKHQRHHKHENAVRVAAEKQLNASVAVMQSQAKRFGANESVIDKQAEADDMGDDIKWHCVEHHHHYQTTDNSQQTTTQPPPIHQPPPPPSKPSLAQKLAPWLIAGTLGAGGAAGGMYLYNQWNKQPPADFDVSGVLGASDIPPDE